MFYISDVNALCIMKYLFKRGSKSISLDLLVNYCTLHLIGTRIIISKVCSRDQSFLCYGPGLALNYSLCSICTKIILGTDGTGQTSWCVP